MNCKFCGSILLKCEHLPTEETGIYVFECHSNLEKGQWYQSKDCKMGIIDKEENSKKKKKK